MSRPRNPFPLVLWLLLLLITPLWAQTGVDQDQRATSQLREAYRQAVEMCVRLFDIPHPAQLTHHFRDFEHALSVWLKMAQSPKSPQSKLLHPRYWSCQSSEAIVRSLDALFCPAIDDIQSIELPSRLAPGYRAVRFFRLIKKALERRGSSEVLPEKS